MKYKFKIIYIAICCLVSVLLSDSQGMDERGWFLKVEGNGGQYPTVMYKINNDDVYRELDAIKFEVDNYISGLISWIEQIKPQVPQNFSNDGIEQIKIHPLNNGLVPLSQKIQERRNTISTMFTPVPTYSDQLRAMKFPSFIRNHHTNYSSVDVSYSFNGQQYNVSIPVPINGLYEDTPYTIINQQHNVRILYWGSNINPNF